MIGAGVGAGAGAGAGEGEGRGGLTFLLVFELFRGDLGELGTKGSVSSLFNSKNLMK